MAMGWAKTGTGCSQLGANGFVMEAGRATLRCGFSGISNWAQTLGGPGLFLGGDRSSGRVAIRGSGQCYHH